MTRRITRFLSPAMLALLAAAAGCSRASELSGVVTDNGQPVVTKNKSDPPVLHLACLDEMNPRTIVCGLRPDDGRFVAYGPDGTTRMPPGKYKVGFTYGSAEPRTGKDFFPGEESMELDLEAGSRLNIVVDAAKRTITK